MARDGEPLIVREAGPGDIGPMHWLARRRNRFIVTADKLVLVEKGSFLPRVSEIPLADIEHVSYRRRLSGGRMFFGANMLTAAVFLFASLYLQVLTYGPAWILQDSASPLLGILLTTIVAVEAVLVLLYANVSEVAVRAQGVRHDLVCSGVRPEDIERVHALRGGRQSAASA